MILVFISLSKKLNLTTMGFWGEFIEGVLIGLSETLNNDNDDDDDD